MDPKKLIDKAKNGDKDAYGQLYSEFYLPVFRYIYFRINQKEEAEDLTQTVFLKAYTSIERYQSRSVDPLAYFYTIARNVVIDYYRRKKELSLESNLGQAMEIPDKKENIEATFIQKENAEKVQQAISKLPLDQKEVIILKFINDLNNAEIARLLGKNEATIRQIQHRALKALKGKIGDKT